MLHSARLFIYSLSNGPIPRPALGAYLEGPPRSNTHPPLISKLLQPPLSVASSVRISSFHCCNRCFRSRLLRLKVGLIFTMLRLEVRLLHNKRLQ